MRSVLSCLFALAALAVLVPGGALAHDNSKPLSPKFGGELVEIDHYAIEMVLSGTSLTFHMLEHGEVHDVTGASFKAVIQMASGMRMIDLKAEGATLSAQLDAPLPPGTKIAVTGKDPHGDVVQARFVTK